MEHGRMPVEHHGLVLLAVDVDDLLAFGDGGKRLAGNLQFGQSLGCGVQLAEAAINEHQARHAAAIGGDALVAAGDHLAHGGEIIHPIHRADDEFAIVGFFHLTVFPNYHRSDRLRALYMGDIEALDAPGQVGKGKRVLESGLLGVVADQINERALFTTLGNQDLDAALALFREQLFQHDAVFEIYGHVDVARHILLINVELLKQRGKKFAGMKFAAGLKLRNLFPEEFTAVKHATRAQVEEVDGEHVVFKVIAESIGVVAIHHGDTLLLLQLLHG